MRATEFLNEFQLPKNKWELVVSNGDKEELGTDLVSLVRQAYSNTPQGSFVNSIKDVIPSDWNVIDWDQDPDVDSCVFYRKNRNGENWQGYKLQGLGHDGTRTSKDKAINKIQQLLSKPGVWIESSDAMRHVLKKLNVPAVTDEQLLQQLFNDPKLKMIDDDTYIRQLSDGTKVTETVFGSPKIMRATDFITELFQPGKKNWEWMFRGSQEAVADFTVGDRQYRWHAFSESNKTKWEIQFRLIRKDTDPEKLDLFGKTGTGNSAEVMSTAVDITRAFLEYYGLDKVEELVFNAKEDSRAGLYAKMIKRLLPDWDLRSKPDILNGGVIFYLTDRRAYDKPENKLSEDKKIARYNGLIMGYAFNDSKLKIKAYDIATKTPLAFVEFVKEDKELYPQMLWVHDDHRNQGIAKSMYDFLKSEGYEINRSHDQTNAGSGFWNKHRGEDAYVWEEVVDEGVNDNYLYHATQPPGIMRILRTGIIKASDRPQAATTAKTKYPTISTTRSKQYAESEDFVDFLNLTREGNSVIIVFDRNAIANHYKMFSTSQGTQTVGDEYEEVIVAPKGSMPIQGTMKGFYFNPRRAKELEDYQNIPWFKELLNSPYYMGPKQPQSVAEEVIDEMPLPADWDPQQMRQGATTFKSRLAYALERAKKLGTGSSRVATTIEYQGRPTVLKIAKNQKGLAQNSVEADILSDGYASQLGILIPIIDYDEQNREPSWIHTELAQKANEKQLCSLLKCPNLSFLVNFATSITGKKRFLGLPQGYIDKLKESGMSDDDVETCTDYANTLADLNSNFDIELGDFARAANWGLYNGKPVIVDVGFNSNVLNQYYKR